jgi:undecaprenyl-phosphate galactose phosphotransferase
LDLPSYLLPPVLLFSDYIAVVLAELAAFYVRKSCFPLWHGSFSIPDNYIYFWTPLIFLIFLYSAKTHVKRLPFWETAREIFYSSLYGITACIAIMYMGGISGVVSRLYMVLLGIFAFMFICAMRYAVKRILGKLGILQIPVILIGAGRTAELVAKSFSRDMGFGYRIVGIIGDYASKELAESYRILGRFDRADRIVRASKVQDVIITAPGIGSEKITGLINKIQPHVKNIAFVPDFMGMPVGNIEAESLFNEKLLLLNVRNNLARRYNRVLKRLFDIIVSLAGLTVILPLGVLIGAAVWLDTGGIIFAHRRIGRNGKEFYCYKFQSMVKNAEKILEKYLSENAAAREEWKESYKLQNDPRVTRLGSFLRKTSLDELPQIINVLKGEMSLVGPRPIVRAETVKYGSSIEDYYLVRPGITGMWQVSGRSDTTYEERVGMDSWYVKNWSVWIDMVYLAKTVKVVLLRKGAY